MTDQFLLIFVIVSIVLWLTLFIFTLIDHYIYRGTYGHFLSGLQAIERRLGKSDAALLAIRSHVDKTDAPYLGEYLAKAESPREPARIAAEAYLAKVGLDNVLARASNFLGRKRQRQVTALYALTRAGRPEVLPLLEEALGESNTLVSYAALDMLGLYGDANAAEILLRAIDANTLPPSRIATQLEHFRADQSALYISRLRQPNAKSRYWAAYLLGKCRYSEQAGAVLARLLQDSDPSVRKIALLALTDLKAPGLQPHAQAMLADPVFYVRTQAIKALSRFANPDSARSLAAMLGDSSDAVQLAAKKALVRLGNVTLELFGQGTAAGYPADAILEITSSIRHAGANNTARLNHA